MPLRTIGRLADAEGLEFLLDPSLILYLPLWKKDAPSFSSDDARGYLCTRTGALWRPNGHYFDGVDDYIDASTAISDGKLGNAWTLWCWGKVTKYTANQDFVGSGNKVNGASLSGFDFNDADDKIYARVNRQAPGGANDVVSLNTYTGDTNFHFLIMMVDADGKVNNFLIDGVSQGSATTNALDVSDHTYMYIGQLAYSGPNTNPLEGTMGEVGLHTRELSVGEGERIRQVTKWRYS